MQRTDQATFCQGVASQWSGGLFSTSFNWVLLTPHRPGKHHHVQLCAQWLAAVVDASSECSDKPVAHICTAFSLNALGEDLLCADSYWHVRRKE